MLNGLPSRWFPLRFHQKQQEAWHSKYRFKILACGRGSGKTEIARRHIVRLLPVRKPWSDPLYFYALPTYAMAKRVAWNPLLDLIPKHWIESINVNSMYIKTVFGSTLYVVGCDNPSRLEGVQWDFGIIDESSDQKPGMFDRSILPALAHRNASCWRIGVPKRFGIGAAEYKEIFDKGLSENNEGIKSWTWPSTDIMTEQQIALAKKVLSPADFREQYEASWESVGGAIFRDFDEYANISERAVYNPSERILVGSDFNVSPMSWCLAHKYNDTLHFFDEISLKNTNTPNTLDELHEMYGEHSARWTFYGDASGRSRRTSAVSSDYAHIRNDERFKGKKIRYPQRNPALANRFAACNALFKNADGRIRCIIHPKCKNLIKDFKVRAYKEGSREPDDTFDIGHMSDAAGYMIYSLFPVRANMFSSDNQNNKVIVHS